MTLRTCMHNYHGTWYHVLVLPVALRQSFYAHQMVLYIPIYHIIASMFKSRGCWTCCLAALLLVATVKVSGFGAAGRSKKAFRIAKHSISTLAEQETTKQYETRTDNQLLSSFSRNPWEAYESTIRLVVDGVVQVHKKTKKTDDYAPTMAFLLAESSPFALPEPPAFTTTDSDTFRSRMDQQRQLFMTAYNLSDNQYQYAIRVLTYMGDYCAKRGLAVPLLVAWSKLRQAGMIPRENCISTYMYALSLDEETQALSGEVATFHDLMFAPSENTIYLRIKSLVGKGNCAEAEGLLESLPVRLLVCGSIVPNCCVLVFLTTANV